MEIDGTIAERRVRRAEATKDVTASWGGAQSVRGPMLYVAKLAFRGSVRLPVATDFPADTAVVHWDRMTLATGLANPRAIRDEAILEWNGGAAALEPGTGDATVLDTGVHAIVAADPGNAIGSVVPFAIRFALAGSDTLQLLPVGSDTDVHLMSKWSSPSFEGAYLPVARTVGAGGFDATWKVLRLARAFPPSWKTGDRSPAEFDASLIGIRLVSPVDAYTTTDRAVKYELLFIYLTFGAMFMIEVLGHLRVHPVQYLLIGFALCLFYHNLGEPISEANLGRVWDRFFTTCGDAGGTGLGLPIVASIVRAHGGSVSVESRSDAGTTFAVILPVAT